MKRMVAGVCLLLVLASALSGCIRISINKKTVELTGETASFTVRPDAAAKDYAILIKDLLLTGNAEIAITPSDEPRVEVECRKSLLDYGFEVVFSGDELTIRTDSPHMTFRGGNVKLHIYANYHSVELAGGYDLKIDGTGMQKIALDVAGAVNCEMENLDAKEVKLDLAGAGNIVMSGKAELLEVTVAGAAKLDAKALTAARADVSISGAGTMTLTVTDTLDAGISGTGTVRYYGDPENVNARVSGAGSIKPAE